MVELGRLWNLIFIPNKLVNASQLALQLSLVAKVFYSNGDVQHFTFHTELQVVLVFSNHSCWHSINESNEDRVESVF